MTARNAKELKALFDEALTLPPEKRAAFVANSCTNDPELAAELEGLLTAHTQADDLEEAISAAADSLLSHNKQEPEAEGRRIGAYRVVNEIGRGGMGRVYLAERDDDQYAGRVAIKLLAPGAAGTAGEERFRNECQVLADLHHPNIAQLLDAGTTEEGEPFIVIEYVEGEPIDEYCDKHKISVNDRIRLFVKLCGAVEHAHRNLVIHRDIKSNNVLVTAEGEPKLLDFGIAKLLDLDRARTLDLHLTGDVSRLLTPATASPEQLQGQPVTTATDVYALGHLLYRLLTGTMPYSVDAKDRFSLPRAIVDEEPKRPSIAVFDEPDAGSGRGTTVDRLARRLTGDLDAIVLKTLRKEPAQRYAAPRELADDLKRFLAHHPVLARGEAFGYKTRRFVTRNAGAIAVAASILVLIASLVTFYTVELAAERDRAQIEARRAEEVAEFLSDLFELATPEESRGADITARELLDRGAVRIGAELADQPSVQASLMFVIGTAYTRLGFYEEATETFERALAIRDALGGTNDQLLGDILHNLGVVHLIQARYAQSEPLLDRALEVRNSLPTPVIKDIAATLRAHASLAQEFADFERAALYLDDAEAIVAILESTEPLPLAEVLVARGDLLNRTGHFDQAIENYARAAELHTNSLGDDHPLTLVARNNIADALIGAGRHGEAEEILREIVEARRRVLPPGHAHLAFSLSHLSHAIKMQGRPEEATPLQEEVLAILRAAHPGDHPEVAIALNNLANLKHDVRDFDGALELHQEALNIKRRLYGDDHPSLADTYNNLAALYNDTGDYAGALLMYQRTLELDRRAFGDNHPFIGPDRLAIGVTQGLLGRNEEAAETARDALEQIRRVSGDDHPQTFNAMRELGIILRRLDRCDEADPLLSDALPGLEKAFPGEPWQVAMARANLGACRAASDSGTGERLMREAYERLVVIHGHDDRFTRQARDLLTNYLRTSDRTAEARVIEQAAVERQ